MPRSRNTKRSRTRRQISSEARAIIDSVGASGETKRLLEIRVPDLIDYQDAAYARRYADVVKKAAQAEQKAVPGQSGYAEAVARFLYKLMAYKDEYEVARLHADPKFIAKLDAQFKDGYTLQYHLAPPTFSKRDPMTGELIKKPYGPHMLAAFRFLAKFKGLRGGALDFFGKTEERRHERQMIEDYIAQVNQVCGTLTPANHAVAVAACPRSRPHPRLRARQGAQREGGQGRGSAPARGVPQSAARRRKCASRHDLRRRT